MTHPRLMWFRIEGDGRLGRCDTEGCGCQPTFRLEYGGVGSNYCSGCRQKIEHQDEPSEATIRRMRDDWDWQT